MALMAWYPLIKDMKNQGVGDADLTTSSTPTFGGGIIGGSLISGGLSYWTAEQTAKILNNNEVSIAFWIYVNQDTGSVVIGDCIFGNNGMDANNNRKFSIFQYPNCNSLHYSWMNDAQKATFMNGVIENCMPSYKWTHVAVTYNNPTIKIYINGELVRTASGVSNSSSFAYQTRVINDENSNRKLCDYRIYNHAISAKEVKELSKGLILHYSLSDIKGANLLPQTDINQYGVGYYAPLNSGSVSVDSTMKYCGNSVLKITPSDVTSDGAYSFFNSSVNLKADVAYTYSCMIYSTVEDTFGFSSLGHFQTIVGSEPHNFRIIRTDMPVPANKWTHVSLSFYAAKDCIFRSFFIYFANTSQVIYVCNVKLEEGDKATPWMPHSSDSAYSIMGYNNNTLYDVSGYCHNSTTKDISYSSDTAKYTTSMVFNGTTSQVIKNDYIFPAGYKFPELSVAFWVKRDDYTDSTVRYIWNDILQIYLSGSEHKFRITWLIATESASARETWETSMAILPPNEWHHVCYVIDGGYAKFYYDGVERSGQDRTNHGTLIESMRYNTMGFGMADTTYMGFGGKLSDFRVYATALSATDVLELYNTAASLSNNGVMFANELVEG